MPEVPEDVDEVGRRVLDAAFRVHRHLGPGLLESVYVQCLAHALRRDGLMVRREVWVPLDFEGLVVPQALRLDLVVEDCVVVEAKAVETLTKVHEAQILSYLRLSGLPLGYLLNFQAWRMMHGIRRFALTRP